MMRIGFISGVLGVFFTLCVHAQKSDSIQSVSLSEVVVTESYRQYQMKKTALTVDVANKDFLRKNFTGNLMQAMANIPGVQAMDIGVGASKPMIRGMGFNRISVVENGIKQEGQQWGADHGLELDAFNAGQVTIRKGPASLLYGSDAMGGAIELAPLPLPTSNQLFGEADLLGKSVNGTLGGSLMLGIKKDAWYTWARYSEQHFGDYRIPADTIVYLTQRMPVYHRKLKNTAGFERDVSWTAGFRYGRYKSSYSVSNVFQKTGFFPGAHGIPDISRLQDDGSSRNIELPYSQVNHLKVSAQQSFLWDRSALIWDIGYQKNHREEWSRFHTHYDTQPVPEKDPDKELAFILNTYSSAVKLKLFGAASWQHIAGWDIQYQRNTISGYSFLLPAYRRFTTGAFWMTTYRPGPALSVSGGFRYDYGKIDASAYTDPYLAVYLREQGYDDDFIRKYEWRSYAVHRHFGDYSGSLGVVWTPSGGHMLQVNIGHSFRLPGANELASNGVHHGTFRHEQGDAALSSERGWQLDVSYTYENGPLLVNFSPFISWFSNYIFLRPTGEWSVLPHAGQIYRYTGAEALFAGGEATVGIDFLRHFNYRVSGEYVYTYNCDEHIPLSFSPPASLRNTLTWRYKNFSIYGEVQHIAAQHRVARNEDPTPGAQLLNAGISANLRMGGVLAEITLSGRNLSDTGYLNHLSFYRKVEIPEPGRNFQILIKVPFKSLLK